MTKAVESTFALVLARFIMPVMLAVVATLTGLAWDDMKSEIHDGLDKQNARMDLFLSSLQDMRERQSADHVQLMEHERRLDSTRSPISFGSAIHGGAAQ